MLPAAYRVKYNSFPRHTRLSMNWLLPISPASFLAPTAPHPSTTGMFLEHSLLAYAELFAFLSMYHVLSYPQAFGQTDLPAWESLPPPSSSSQTLTCLSRPSSGVKCTIPGLFPSLWRGWVFLLHASRARTPVALCCDYVFPH